MLKFPFCVNVVFVATFETCFICLGISRFSVRAFTTLDKRVQLKIHNLFFFMLRFINVGISWGEVKLKSIKITLWKIMEFHCTLLLTYIFHWRNSIISWKFLEDPLNFIYNIYTQFTSMKALRHHFQSFFNIIFAAKCITCLQAHSVIDLQSYFIINMSSWRASQSTHI